MVFAESVAVAVVVLALDLALAAHLLPSKAAAAETESAVVVDSVAFEQRR